jgi:hypothetical protein
MTLKTILNKYFGAKFLLIATLGITCTITASCTDANFSGGAARSVNAKKKPPAKKPPSITLKDVEFAGDKKIEPVQNNKIWTSSTGPLGVIKRFTIEGDKVIDQKTWNGGGAGEGGMRSYVTEGGFLGARFPNLYFIDPEKPNVIESKSIMDLNPPVGLVRMCVASYMKDGKRYMIAAYGNGEYVEYLLDDKPPYKPLWNKPNKRGTIAIPDKWGYSCFIDQTQKIFYSQWFWGPKTGGLNLKTYQAVDVSQTVPNANFNSSTPGVETYSNGARGGSYVMSGDSYGNLYNGKAIGIDKIYSSAFDKASDSVWFSSYTSSTLVVIDRKCLTTSASCTNYKSFSMGIKIGPMSALRDGRIVGLVRGTGDVYIMKLRDKTNLGSGIDAVKVGSAGGDAYMYTDFTGATLYINESEQTFKPTEMPKYDPAKPIKIAVFKWLPTPTAAAGNLSVEWKNIKLEARCYSNAASKPAFEEVVKVNSSDQGTHLSASTCKEGKYDFVDVKLTQINNDSTLLNVDSISVGFKQ